METTLKQEIDKTVNFFAETDLKLSGVISDGTKEIAEVQKVKLPILKDLYQLAYRAHSGTSFSPEKRADSIVNGYSEELESDLVKIPEGERERYIQNYRKYLSNWLSAKSRCISPMITGPANFPVRRNEKANNSERKRGEEFFAWRERALHAIEKQRLASRPESEILKDQFKQIKRHMAESAATILMIDTGENTYSARPLFVSSLTGTIKRLAKNGKGELLKLALDYVKELNKWVIEKGGKEIVTAKNGIWKLEQVAVAAIEEKADLAVKGNGIEKMSFPNSIGDIEIVKNYQMDRIQIMFPGKPSEEIRTILKGEAFKWAPSQSAWQRQLTGNAEWAAKRMIQKFLQIETDAVGRMAI